MQIKVYVIDVKLPRWLKRTAIVGAFLGVLFGLGALVYAAAVTGQPDFNDGDVLTAAGMNAHLGALQNQINAVASGLDPSYVNTTGDTMTGPLALPADGLTVGGAQFACVGGNVGIGTSAPSAALEVNGNVKADGDFVAQGVQGGLTVHSHAKSVSTSWTTIFTVGTASFKGFAAQFVVSFRKEGVGYGIVTMNCLAQDIGSGTAAVQSYNTHYANMDTEVELQAIASGADVLFQVRVNPTYPGTAGLSAVLAAQGNHTNVVKN